MINWQSVIFNSFWISGLALLLAAFSYHYWDATQNDRSLRQQLSRPGFLFSFWFAMLLVSIGLVGTSQQLWEMALWGILALLAIVAIAGLARSAAT